MGKKGAQAKERNPNWKGGINYSTSGYIKILLPDHPKADSKGYVYEHIVVAEKKLGRPLLSGEKVHHLDENKHNNDPNNISVLPSTRHHRYFHRKIKSDKRKPDEPNPIIICECGCGSSFSKYDSYGRPRKYISGHNTQIFPLKLCQCGCGQTTGGKREYLSWHNTKKHNNPTILCACGCGQSLKKYDEHGRERKYIHTHWRKNDS